MKLAERLEEAERTLAELEFEDMADDVAQASRALAAMEEALMEVKYRGLPDRYVSDMRLAEQVDAALKLARETNDA